MSAVTTFPPVSGVDTDNYYNKTEVESLIASAGAGGTIDLSNYYKKLETYSKAQVDAMISSGTIDLSDYYTRAQVDGLLDSISLDDYYTKTQTEALLSNKVEKEAGKGLSTNDFTNTFKQAYDGHLASTSNPHSTTAGQVGAYTKAEVDGFVGAKLDKNTAIVGATKTKITYDSKGLVTNGADLVEADIPTLSQSKITNLVSDLSSKQDNLVSGTSIKTINGESVLGSGDIVITGGGSGGGYFTGTAGITVGGITTGDTFTDVPVTNMINNLINPELTPNLTNPNNVLTSTVSGLREIGTSITPRLTATFNRGSISPQYSASEPYRAGLPTKYVFTSTAGLNQEVETDATTYGIDVSSFEVALGTVTFSSNISYSAGPQPTTSKGNVFDNPLPAGTTGNKTVTITGVYPCYNGISTLTKMTLANHGGTITVDAPADMNVGGERFKIQYPTVWSAKTPVVQQENELSKAWDNQNMSDYSITTIDKNGVSYKQVEYVGAGIGARKLRLVF